MNFIVTEKTVKLEIEVTPETAKDVEDLLLEGGWQKEECLPIVLGIGMGAVRVQWMTDTVMDDESEPLERMKARLASVEGSLATLRFRMFEMEQTNQAWDLSTGAIRNQNVGFKAIINRQQKELDELKTLLKTKRWENEHSQEELEGYRRFHQQNLINSPHHEKVGSISCWGDRVLL